MSSKENKIGLLTTIIVHLVILIIFLIFKINEVVRVEQVFELDFTGQEEYEQLQKLEAAKETAAKELEELLKDNRSASPYRNVAVDRSAKSPDNAKGRDKVFDEARELQKRLDASKRAAEEALDSESEGESDGRPQQQENAPAYTGASLLSYTLDGRKAINIPIPAYKCVGAGDVSVRITVNRKGYVVAAQIIENASAADECLRSESLQAARRSRFTASANAPERQIGEIVYRFVAQ